MTLVRYDWRHRAVIRRMRSYRPKAAMSWPRAGAALRPLI